MSKKIQLNSKIYFINIICFNFNAISASSQSVQTIKKTATIGTQYAPPYILFEQKVNNGKVEYVQKVYKKQNGLVSFKRQKNQNLNSLKYQQIDNLSQKFGTNYSNFSQKIKQNLKQNVEQSFTFQSKKKQNMNLNTYQNYQNYEKSSNYNYKPSYYLSQHEKKKLNSKFISTNNKMSNHEQYQNYNQRFSQNYPPKYVANQYYQYENINREKPSWQAMRQQRVKKQLRQQGKNTINSKPFQNQQSHQQYNQILNYHSQEDINNNPNHALNAVSDQLSSSNDENGNPKYTADPILIADLENVSTIRRRQIFQDKTEIKINIAHFILEKNYKDSYAIKQYFNFQTPAQATDLIRSLMRWSIKSFHNEIQLQTGKNLKDIYSSKMLQKFVLIMISKKTQSNSRLKHLRNMLLTCYIKNNGSQQLKIAPKQLIKAFDTFEQQYKLVAKKNGGKPKNYMPRK